MPGFYGRSDLVSSVANGWYNEWNFYKAAPASVNTGVWATYWTTAGSPAAGAAPAATPGTAYAADQTTQTAGAIWFPDRSPNKKFITRISALATDRCTVMFYDRLVGVSGISLATTGNKTISSTALTRYTGTAAVNNEVWLEVTTATTTTAPVVNLNSYTSADGTTALSGGSVTFPSATTVVGSLIQLPLDASRRGVRSVEVGLNVGTAAAAGVVNLIIIRPLARIWLRPNEWNEVSFIDDFLTLPQVSDDANIGIAIQASTNPNATPLVGRIRLAWG